MKTTEEEKCTFAPKITKYVKPPEESITSTKTKALQKLSQNYDYLNSSNNENRMEAQSKTSSQKRIPKSATKPREKEAPETQDNQEEQENANEEEKVPEGSLNQSRKKETKPPKKDLILQEKRKKEKEEQEKAKLEAEKKEQEK